ncbi:MAG: transposase [Pyrinomonadaceae bacterium]|nr:transposase [Pyrinomonadaceae bacterium]
MVISTQPTRLDYCQYLVSSQINYTLTNFAEHSSKFSHDQLNRLMRDEKMTPRLVWEQTREQIVTSPNGYMIFDDTVADKNHSRLIELARRQWSGNAKSVIRGIGIVTCIYVNPELGKFWLIDYRIFAPSEDGKTKLDHAKEMFDLSIHGKHLEFRAVLMDTWYATRQFMLHIERNGKIYYCPVQTNRQVDEGDGAVVKYQPVDALSWSTEEKAHGKNIHVKDFPKGHRLQLFRLVVSTDRTDYVVTNDTTQNSTDDTRVVCAIRWKIEQLHREAKQVTGLERCQCRVGRIQRNHIACAMLVWCRFKELAYETGRTVYQIKFGQLSDYLIQQLKTPSVKMSSA